MMKKIPYSAKDGIRNRHSDVRIGFPFLSSIQIAYQGYKAAVEAALSWGEGTRSRIEKKWANL